MKTHQQPGTEYIVLTFRAFEEDGVFVSECVELQTASQGETPEQAISNAQEATLLYLDTIVELGDEDRVFRDRGIRVLGSIPDEIELRASVHPDDIVKPVVQRLPHRAAMSA